MRWDLPGITTTKVYASYGSGPFSHEEASQSFWEDPQTSLFRLPCPTALIFSQQSKICIGDKINGEALSNRQKLFAKLLFF